MAEEEIENEQGEYEVQDFGGGAVEMAAGAAEGIAYQAAKKWIWGIQAGLLASWFGAPVALIIGTVEWAYQFFFNPKWPMPVWEKAATFVGDLVMAVVLIMLLSLLFGGFYSA